MEAKTMNELVLYGTVGRSFWEEEYFTALEVREQLAGMTGDLTVRINSGGGIAHEGQAIYTALKDYEPALFTGTAPRHVGSHLSSFFSCFGHSFLRAGGVLPA
ncbi:hypothetical protein [Citreimonas sp.]|uniref:hypothetical protein n=1 Tax=Citreimonas sp. TaxID=3036715 RepID=UPI00405A37F0